jgi:hypothetical protein
VRSLLVQSFVHLHIHGITDTERDIYPTSGPCARQCSDACVSQKFVCVTQSAVATYMLCALPHRPITTSCVAKRPPSDEGRSRGGGAGKRLKSDRSNGNETVAKGRTWLVAGRGGAGVLLHQEATRRCGQGCLTPTRNSAGIAGAAPLEHH